MKDIKQGVSKFTEKDLTPNSAHSFTEGSDIGPLETHVQSELEKIQAGHEGYKVVPAPMMEDVIKFLIVLSVLFCNRNQKQAELEVDCLIEKLKSL